MRRVAPVRIMLAARSSGVRWTVLFLNLCAIWGCTEAVDPSGAGATSPSGAGATGPSGAGVTGGREGTAAGGTSDGGGSGGEDNSVPPLMLGALLPENEWPTTIPSVREWRAYGEPDAAPFSPTDQSRIWTAPGNTALADVAQTLADDMSTTLGIQLDVTEGTAAGPSDIALVLTPTDPALGEEGYVLAIGDTVTIQANTVQGVFWGTRTLLQLLFQSTSLSPGAARDWPTYAERGFMIDNGRSYFTPDWLRTQIQRLSYLKMNLFHWHLSDKEGFRIESKTHPEIVSDSHLSQKEVADIEAFAARYHVEIVPEFDVPGHMDAILKEHPELIAEQDTYPSAQLDYTKEEGRALIRDIFEEMLEVFGGRYFHIGADEFTPYYDAAWTYAQMKYGGNPEVGGLDVAIAYINELAALIREHDKVPRAWSDVLAPNGVVEELDRSIILENWIDRGTSAAALIDAGFSLLNANWECTYSKDDVTILSDGCAPTRFTDGTILSADNQRLMGMKYHVWCDPAEYFCPDEQTVSSRIELPLRALAQNVWGSPRLFEDVDEFRSQAEAVGPSLESMP